MVGPRGVRRYSIDGFEVCVGRRAADNDRLTFAEAEPHDFWLHVARVSGSHVVVRNPEHLSDLPRPVVERAAQLAAWHSKARQGRGKVEVHLCRVSEVSKPAGFAAGKVRLRCWRSVRVYPKPPTEPPPGAEETQDGERGSGF